MSDETTKPDEEKIKLDAERARQGRSWRSRPVLFVLVISLLLAVIAVGASLLGFYAST